MPDDLAQLVASLPDPVGRCPAPYGLLEVRGPDAVDFLQRLCTQDVAGLAADRCAPGAFLSPKGKLVATAVFARTLDGVRIEVQRHALAEVAELLDRYHFTEKLAVERVDATCAESRGPGAARAAGAEPGACVVTPAGAVRVCVVRHGSSCVRWHGPAATVAAEVAALPGAADEFAELWRIAALEPWLGVDTEPTTLALEAGLDDHVSLTKGCYTGQEIVARIHTYGHVNRQLVRVLIDAPAPIERATPLCDAEDGTPLGRVMSAATIPGTPRSLALGYLPEAFLNEPAPLVLRDAGGPRAQVVGGSLGPA
ncbi:MAG: hypothetical protein IPM29_12720 [Planctomycetes bacterium]|nr:hypothetical protein [Planctomycetota bacterium]